MPFQTKVTDIFRSAVNLAVRLCVITVWWLFVTVALTGCSTQKDSSVFLFEENSTVSEEKTTDTVLMDQEQTESQTDGPTTQALFVVHICGAVQYPGVYELAEGLRVMDAVNVAGGFTDEAAQDARNLAERITDASRIYIPTLKELEESAEGTSGYEKDIVYGDAFSSDDGLVNINTADAAKLKTLPGIGESRAAAIIAYRQQYGAFSCIEDIMKVTGIKQAAFDRLKSRITV